jgi:hypothetical protein
MSPPRVVDPRLLGTWRSDAALTLPEWVFAEGTTDAQQSRIRSLFGKFTMRYTAARVFTEFEGDRTVCSYRVVATDPDSVAILRRTEGKNEIQHIHFIESSVYWVSVGRNREFFRRAEA